MFTSPVSFLIIKSTYTDAGMVMRDVKKSVYIVLSVLLIVLSNLYPIGDAIRNEYKNLDNGYVVSEYHPSANLLSPYGVFNLNALVSDHTIESGSGRIMAMKIATESLCIAGTDEIVEQWYYLEVTLDDDCYYAYRETEFVFTEGDSEVLMVGDDISFDYHVADDGKRILDQVIDTRDPGIVVNRELDREAQLKADKVHAGVSVVLRALPIILIEIGILAGVYCLHKKTKSNPDRSWKKVYADSSFLICFVLCFFICMTFIQQNICRSGSSVLCAIMDSMYPSIVYIIWLVPIFAVIALVIYLIIASMKKDGKLAALIILLILLAAIGISLYVYIRSYNDRARNAEISVVHAHAPIIYIYNEENEDENINVSLDLDGELDVTYPLYDESCGWNVTATSDGVLEDEDGNTYPFLFWEATLNMDYDLSRGFCVRGSDTESFLNEALAELGLNEKEAADFMSYWLPLMEGNEYNVITFQTTAYEDASGLIVTPEPDVTVRINMLWYASSEYVEIEPQELEDMNPSLADRSGLTLVEWGGEVIDEPV